MKWNLEEAVWNNPMMIEVTRFRRRYLTLEKSNAANVLGLGMLVVVVVGAILLVLSTGGTVSPISLIYLQTALFCFTIPNAAHAAIAGEREKRSWDMLLVAPVSHAQIVAGKYLAVLVSIAVLASACGVCILFAGFTFPYTDWPKLLLAEIISITFAVLVASFTLFISARNRRAFTALGIVLGTLLLCIAILPAFWALLTSGMEAFTEIGFYLNPFFAISQVDRPYGSLRNGGPWVYGLPHAFLYLLLSVVLLQWASMTLTFADNEKRFLPQPQKDA